MLYLDIVFIIVLVGYIYWFYGLITALRSDAPYLPIEQKVLDRMVAMVKPEEGDLWVDLGSGDGRVLIAAAKRYSIKGLGLEKVSVLRLISRFNIFRAGVLNRVIIKKGDFFKENLSGANVISFYLLPDTHQRLWQKLKKEARPGTKLIFHKFPIEGVRLMKEDKDLELFLAVV
jgi:hypothetical protein